MNSGPRANETLVSPTHASSGPGRARDEKMARTIILGEGPTLPCTAPMITKTEETRLLRFPDHRDRRFRTNVTINSAGR